MELEATLLRDNRWAVRPQGQLGTCGWHPKPWEVVYVTAFSEAEAVRKAKVLGFKREQPPEKPDKILTKKLSEYSDKDLAAHILESKHLDSIDPTMVELARRLNNLCVKVEIERLMEEMFEPDAHASSS